jgi:hypothetical protein
MVFEKEAGRTKGNWADASLEELSQLLHRPVTARESGANNVFLTGEVVQTPLCPHSRSGQVEKLAPFFERALR